MTKIYALEKGLVGKCSLGDARGRKNREKLREEEENPGRSYQKLLEKFQ